MIYKMFDGRHIDLTKILDVSPAKYVHCNGSHVEFSIQYQLRDSEISYKYDLYPPEVHPIFREVMTFSFSRPIDHEERAEIGEKARAILQLEIDTLVEVWRSL